MVLLVVFVPYLLGAGGEYSRFLSVCQLASSGFLRNSSELHLAILLPLYRVKPHLQPLFFESFRL